MYIIYNKYRNAYKTYEGWTYMHNGAMLGLEDVIRFTEREAELNKDNLPKGSEFRHFPNYRRALDDKDNRKDKEYK